MERIGWMGLVKVIKKGSRRLEYVDLTLCIHVACIVDTTTHCVACCHNKDTSCLPVCMFVPCDLVARTQNKM